MKPNEPSPLTREQLETLRRDWQPEGALPANLAGRAVKVARRQQRARRVALAGLAALLAAGLFAWSQQQEPAAVAELVQPEAAPVVIAAAKTDTAAPPVAEGGLLPQPQPKGFMPPPTRESDLVAAAIVLPAEHAVKSRRHYRDSFRELGDEYDGLADIYFDESGP